MRLLPQDIIEIEDGMIDRICDYGKRNLSRQEIHARIRWAFATGKYCAHLALDAKTQELSEAREEAFRATFRVLEKRAQEKEKK